MNMTTIDKYRTHRLTSHLKKLFISSMTAQQYEKNEFVHCVWFGNELCATWDSIDSFQKKIFFLKNWCVFIRFYCIFSWFYYVLVIKTNKKLRFFSSGNHVNGVHSSKNLMKAIHPNHRYFQNNSFPFVLINSLNHFMTQQKSKE